MRSILRALAFSGVIASLIACSGANASNSGSGGSPGGGGGAANSGGINTDGGGEGGTLSQVCGGDLFSGENVPLDLFIMLDQSSSMGDSSKWANVTAALNSFFAAPPLSNLSAGLQYFGQPEGPCTQDVDCGFSTQMETFTCTNGQCIDCVTLLPGVPPVCLPPGLADSCNVADYAKAEVPIAPLDAAQAALLTGSIAQHHPSTGTPTSAALAGAIQFAAGWQNSHTDHKTVVVLATDGEPSGCDNDIGHIAQIAQQGASGTPPIDTFVVGVGSSLHDLDPVAAAGGTGTAIVVDYSQQAFSDALKQISNQAAACDYVLPTGSSTVDIHKVNVQYTRPGDTDPTVIPKVSDATACGPDGWYYDNDTAPTRVIVCPASCDAFTAVDGTKVEFKLGCPTILH